MYINRHRDIGAYWNWKKSKKIVINMEQNTKLEHTALQAQTDWQVEKEA